MPPGTVDDLRMVVYDSSHTDPIVVCVDNTFVAAAEGGFEATLCFPSTGDCSRKTEEGQEEVTQAPFFGFFFPWRQTG